MLTEVITGILEKLADLLPSQAVAQLMRLLGG